MRLTGGTAGAGRAACGGTAGAGLTGGTGAGENESRFNRDAGLRQKHDALHDLGASEAYFGQDLFR